MRSFTVIRLGVMGVLAASSPTDWAALATMASARGPEYMALAPPLARVRSVCAYGRLVVTVPVALGVPSALKKAATAFASSARLAALPLMASPMRPGMR